MAKSYLSEPGYVDMTPLPEQIAEKRKKRRTTVVILGIFICFVLMV